MQCGYYFMGSNVGGLPQPTGLLENFLNGRLQTGSRIFADEDEDNMAGEASDRGKACEFPERIIPAHWEEPELSSKTVRHRMGIGW